MDFSKIKQQFLNTWYTLLAWVFGLSTLGLFIRLWFVNSLGLYLFLFVILCLFYKITWKCIDAIK